eukprot:gb/GFBE01066745.1/.p1 GENE.gb/GFBE01066745.1/~~gb/GFBE01066745.1/.p1  ORF type:complete len:184 (+),score=43.04 gb/GFBE01066745.1/:1-552(+)
MMSRKSAALISVSALIWEASSQQITKDSTCKPDKLSGVYTDLHDGNNKIIRVDSNYGVTILPPAPGSKFYVDGIGKDWILSPSDVGPISFNCRVSDIDFNVPNKPAPPPGNVTADWVFTPPETIPWVAHCGPETVGRDACGKAGAFADRASPEPMIALAFGSFSDAGNVWVKTAEEEDAEMIV